MADFACMPAQAWFSWASSETNLEQHVVHVVIVSTAALFATVECFEEYANFADSRKAAGNDGEHKALHVSAGARICRAALKARVFPGCDQAQGRAE